MEDETALGVVHETEVLVRLLDRDNVHEPDRVVDISANLVGGRASSEADIYTGLRERDQQQAKS